MNYINELGIKNIIQFHTKVELIAEHGDDGITLSIGCESVGIEPKLFVTARGHVRKFKTISAIRSMLSRVGLDDHKLIIKA